MFEVSEIANDLLTGIVKIIPNKEVYYPYKSLAIYLSDNLPLNEVIEPIKNLSDSLANATGIGCTVLLGIPKKIPAGAVVITYEQDLVLNRPELLAKTIYSEEKESYSLYVGNYALVNAANIAGITYGIRTLSIIVDRYTEKVPGCIILDYPKCQQRGVIINEKNLLTSPEKNLIIIDIINLFKGNEIQVDIDENILDVNIESLEYLKKIAQAYKIKIVPRVSIIEKINIKKYSPEDIINIIKKISKIFGTKKIVLKNTPQLQKYDVDIRKKIVDKINKTNLEKVTIAKNFFLGIEEYIIKNKENKLAAKIKIEKNTNYQNAIEGIPKEMPLEIEVETIRLANSNDDWKSFYQKINNARKIIKNFKNTSLYLNTNYQSSNGVIENQIFATAILLSSAWNVKLIPEVMEKEIANIFFNDKKAISFRIWDEIAKIFDWDISKQEKNSLIEMAKGKWPENKHDYKVLEKIEEKKILDNIKKDKNKIYQLIDQIEYNKNLFYYATVEIITLEWVKNLGDSLPKINRLIEMVKNNKKEVEIELLNEVDELIGACKNKINEINAINKETNYCERELINLVKIKEKCQNIKEKIISHISKSK